MSHCSNPSGCSKEGEVIKFGKSWCESHAPLYDVVKAPKHYTNSAIQPIDAIDAWGLDFALGNVIRYVSRAGKKDGEPEVRDLEKAMWYLKHAIERRGGNRDHE